MAHKYRNLRLWMENRSFHQNRYTQSNRKEPNFWIPTSTVMAVSWLWSLLIPTRTGTKHPRVFTGTKLSCFSENVLTLVNSRGWGKGSGKSKYQVKCSFVWRNLSRKPSYLVIKPTDHQLQTLVLLKTATNPPLCFFSPTPSSAHCLLLHWTLLCCSQEVS